MPRRSQVPLVPTVLALAALLMALDGPAWAGRLISGDELRLRSIKANRIARNALTGVEINERTLGKVPTAARADRAVTAGTAGAAQRAESARLAEQAAFAFRTDATALADRATIASRADRATAADRAEASVFAFGAGNAERFGNLLPGAFERARIDAGRATHTAAGGATIIANASLGAEVRTDGDGDAARDLVLRNTRPAGSVEYVHGSDPPGALAAGDEDVVTSPVNAGQAVLLADGAQFWQVRCDWLAATVHCVGIRSQPNG